MPKQQTLSDQYTVPCTRCIDPGSLRWLNCVDTTDATKPSAAADTGTTNERDTHYPLVCPPFYRRLCLCYIRLLFVIFAYRTRCFWSSTSFAYNPCVAHFAANFTDKQYTVRYPSFRSRTSSRTHRENHSTKLFAYIFVNDVLIYC